MTKQILVLSVCFTLLVSCGSTKISNNSKSKSQIENLKILALGDSYTIGESVCETCRFPVQLKERLKTTLGEKSIVSVDIIAKTGWTTTNLINAVDDQTPKAVYDIVTLLIGVNNQYQGKDFSLYEQEFPLLAKKAIEKAKGDKSNVIVISIPDYAFTPFGQKKTNPKTISNELDDYNNFAQDYCLQNDITFINITDITRDGLTMPDLVASDGLHPSELAYSKFVERLLPVVLEKIQ